MGRREENGRKKGREAGEGKEGRGGRRVRRGREVGREVREVREEMTGSEKAWVWFVFYVLFYM